ncbi:MAG: FkbM family methyltransferase [Alphaproteobacteria bacterium]|nr:FkbM family methyltransferase [Alphaproteobacteria bacterium]
MLPADGVVLDVGAHAGQFAKLFAGLVPEGTVYAFEPSAHARSILTLAVRARRLRNIAVVAAALGDKPGEASLSTPVKAAGSVRFGLAHLGTAAAGVRARRRGPRPFRSPLSTRSLRNAPFRASAS